MRLGSTEVLSDANRYYTVVYSALLKTTGYYPVLPGTARSDLVLADAIQDCRVLAGTNRY